MSIKFKIIVALCETDIAKAMADQLRDHYNVELADNAEEVYAKVHEIRPELAIVDYSLAKINPIELHEGIEFLHPDTMFVICVDEENYEVARRIWFQRSIDYIKKPFDLNRVLDDVHKIVRHIVDKKYIVTLKERVKSLEEENSRLKKLL